MIEPGKGGEGPAPRGGLRWTLFGRLSMTAANGVLMLLCALVFMDEATFGLFATVVGAQLLASRAVLAGLDQGIVRLFTAGRSPDAVVRSGVTIAGTFGAIAILTGAAIAAIGGIGRFEPAFALAIGLGAAGTAWFDLGCASMLARLEFRRAGTWMAAVPAARMVVTLAACALSAADSRVPFLVFPAATLAGGVVVVAGAVARHGLRPDPRTVLRVFGYSWWIGLGDAAAVLALQSGLFLLTGFGMEAEAGRYAFALQLVQAFFAVFVAFYQALLPKAARLPGPAALPAFLVRSWKTGLLLVAATALSAVVASAVLPPILDAVRPDLAGFVPGFLGLAAFTSILMLEAPLGVACQYLLRPRLHVAALWLRCVLIGGLGTLLVPSLGEVGAGLSQAGGALLAATALFVAVQAAIVRRRREEGAPCAAS